MLVRILLSNVDLELRKTKGTTEGEAAKTLAKKSCSPKTPFWDADRPKSGVLIQDWQSILSKGVEVEPNQGSQSIGIIWNSWSTFSWSSQLPYFIAPRAISVCIIFCIIFSSNASPDWGQRRAFCTQQLHLYICWEYSVWPYNALKSVWVIMLHILIFATIKTNLARTALHPVGVDHYL